MNIFELLKSKLKKKEEPKENLKEKLSSFIASSKKSIGDVVSRDTESLLNFIKSTKEQGLERSPILTGLGPELAAKGKLPAPIQKFAETPSKGILDIPRSFLFGDLEKTRETLLSQKKLFKGERLEEPERLAFKKEQRTRMAEYGSLAGTVTPITDPVQKIISAIKEVEPLKKEQVAQFSAERSKRLGTAMGAWGEGEEGFYKALGKLKGELPKVQYESIKKNFTQDDVNSLFSKIKESPKIYGYEKFTAANGLSKLLGEEGSSLPNKGELKLLNEVYGEEFVQAVMSRRPIFQKIVSEATSALNMPRALMASVDLSAPLRQGGPMLATHPKQWFGAFKSMFKQAVSENEFKAVQDEIRARPSYELMKDSKLALTNTGTDMLEREEAFMSTFTEKIPLVRGSERGYVGFLNKLRADVFDTFVKAGKDTGMIDDPKYLKDAAKYVNTLTGRGGLGGLEPAAPIMNALFWSPRLQSARIGMLNPAFYVNLQPQVRTKALKGLLAQSALVLTAVGLAKAAGLEVGTDPRSADFGKAKKGNTRMPLDFALGGVSQYIRLGAQLYTGQLVSSTTGKLTTVGEGYKPLTRFDILQRGIEMKESPAMSFATMLLRNQDFLGQEPNIPAEIADRFIPMVAQDLYDLAQEDPSLLPLGVLPVFGMGMQTYGKSEPQITPNAVGEPQVKIEPVKGLGEKLTDFLQGKKEVDTKEPLPTGSATSWYSYLNTLPPEEAEKKFQYIQENNSQLATGIKKEAKYAEAGASPEDISLKNLGVQDGKRSAKIIEKLNKLKTPEEKEMYYQLLKKIGIITDTVDEQIKKRLGSK